MQVDRAEFLRLAALLFGIAGCGDRAPPPAGPASSTPAEKPQPTVVSPGDGPLENRVVEAPPPAGDVAADPACSNQRGTMRACARVSPTCEGLREECKQLDEQLVPRVAERWAECFANAKTACRPKSLGACMQAAAESACVEPGAVTTCKTLMKACDDANTPPKYTLEQCAKIVSAVKPGGVGEWKEVDEERMGPGRSKTACSLEYVLPYQPYGWMWR